MHRLLPLVLLLRLFICSQALIVPQELPSILSVVYPNIPPIKKGTDSRLGFGFRLGEHADFQVMLELGPQTETRKIGGVQASKRQVDSKEAPESTTIKAVHQDAASWLANWSNDMTMAQKKRKKAILNAKKSPTTTTSTTSTTIRTVPLISKEALQQLQLLFKSNNSQENAARAPTTTQEPETVTKSKEEQRKITEELMDIDLK